MFTLVACFVNFFLFFFNRDALAQSARLFFSIQYYLYEAWPLWLPIMSILLVGNISLCSVETLECFPDPTVLHVSELWRGTKKWQKAVSVTLSILTAREHTRAGNSGLASYSYPTHCTGQLRELRHLLIQSTLYITRIQFKLCLWSYCDWNALLALQRVLTKYKIRAQWLLLKIPNSMWFVSFSQTNLLLWLLRVYADDRNEGEEWLYIINYC